MNKRFLPGLASLLALAPPALAQTLSIEHQPVACATAGKFPRLEARFAPTESVATARVVFQGQTADWYSVLMKPEGPGFAGVLPKPKKDLKSFRYYIEVTDKSLGTARTPENTVGVVDSASACKGKLMAGAVGTASVILQGPTGVAALPAGFASSGVVAGSAAGGGSAAGASAAAGGGGGLATGVIIAGAGAGLAAAGAAVVVASKNGEESNSGGGTTVAPPATYDVVFQPPTTLNIAACGAVGNITGLAGIQPDSSGAFNMLQTQSTPVLRMTGQVTPTTFQATLACTNGAQSGSLSATGANNSYSGTFTFGSQSGALTVTKR